MQWNSKPKKFKHESIRFLTDFRNTEELIGKWRYYNTKGMV